MPFLVFVRDSLDEGGSTRSLLILIYEALLNRGLHTLGFLCVATRYSMEHLVALMLKIPSSTCQKRRLLKNVIV